MLEGIVLNRTPFREHDEVISVITRDSGRVDVRAKGVKKITSKLSSHLEPFSYIAFDFVQGKEMAMLITAALLNSFSLIRTEFTKAMQADYAAHTVYKLTRPGNIENGIFELFFSWLSVIEKASHVFDCRFLDWFMLQLMGQIGFKPRYAACVQCEKTTDSEYWSYQQGGVLCDLCASGSFQGDSIVRIAELTLRDLSRLDLSGLNQLESDPAYTPALHSLIFRSLQYHSEVKIGDWKHTCTI
jgi:DNA repair protein RecO (recombination protein O)